MEMAQPPFGTAPPANPVSAPMMVTGTPSAEARARIAAISSSLRGVKTWSARPA